MGKITENNLSNYSTFTTDKGYKLDEFVEFTDIQADEYPLVEELQTLLSTQNKTPEQLARMNELSMKFADKIPTSYDWNKFCSCLISMEKFILVEINGYIALMKKDLKEYTDTKKNEIEALIGQMDYKELWNVNAQYKRFNQVKHNGNIYTARKDNSGQEPNLIQDTEHWQITSMKGDTGKKGDRGYDGSNLVYKEDYNDNETYNKNNVVSYDGRLYVCVVDGTKGMLPTNLSNWKLGVDRGQSMILKTGKSTVNLKEDSNVVPIEIPQFNPKEDTLLVHYQGSYLEEHEEYEISADGLTIERTDGGLWKKGSTFNHLLFKNVTTGVPSADPSLMPDRSINKNKLNPSILQEIDDKIAILNDSIMIESKTYAELKTLKDNNQLKQGKKYLLTDYRTKYQQPTTLVIKEMAVEQLVLTANSTNSFEPIVSSPTYPQDIITYNFNDNKCEDTTTDRTGFIQRRTDTIAKNDCPQDWRTMLWARYKPDAIQYYKDGVLTNYSVWTSGNAVMGVVYKSGNRLYKAKNTDIPSSMEDNTVFYRVYEDINVGMLIEDKTKIADKIELKKGELHERLTFGDSCYRNYIGYITARGHNNVLGNSCTSINLGLTNYDNTLGNSCTVNYLGDNSYKNIIFNNCTGNSFDVYCGGNIIGRSCVSNRFGSNADKNILTYSCDNNSFDNDCNENILGSTCNRNSFGNRCYSNTLASDCTNNSFGNECHSNVFGNSCGNNSFGNGCHSNVTRTTFGGNIFGNNCYENIFDSACGYNIFTSLCIKNTFGYNCSYNNLSDSRSNTFGSNMAHVLIKSLNYKNTSNISDINSGGFTKTIEKLNSSDEKYVYWYLNNSNQPIYTAIP